MYWTGIGSRQTPILVTKLMTHVAYVLECEGLILRSGGADGADLAFERGIRGAGKEIWVPWLGFNNSTSTLLPSDDAFILARTVHPVFDKLSKGAKALHARNCHQVLGADLDTPSKFLICWTDGGATIGGTATAIKLALNNNVPVLNLGKWSSLQSLIDAIDDFFILIGENYEI